MSTEEKKGRKKTKNKNKTKNQEIGIFCSCDIFLRTKLS